MRHMKRGRKLGRSSSHRKAMVRNLVASLFEHGRVQTTPAKAKEARPFAEKMITLGKNGTLHARRRAISLLHDTKAVSKLFSEIAPQYTERHGGYCRILHMADHRIGDGAPQVLFELVEAEMKSKGKKKAKKVAVAKPAKEEAPAPAEAEAPTAEKEESSEE